MDKRVNAKRVHPKLRIGLYLLCLLHTGAGGAASRYVGGEGIALQAVIDAAQPGDELHIGAGVYVGALQINKTLSLIGEAGAILDGAQHGHVVHIQAPDVTLRGLLIRHSGLNLTTLDAGVFVDKSAARVRIEHNRLEANAFGIWLDGSQDARIIGNSVQGIQTLRSQDRGNGIHLFNVSGAQVIDNDIWHTRDGIYIDTSDGNTLQGNRIHHLRYGIHYMYSHHNHILNNLTHHTRTGYALMQSNTLRVVGNRSEHDGNYGMLLNYIIDSEIADNHISDVSQGSNPFAGGALIEGAEGKAIFIYNSVRNRIHHNRFSRADIGVHLTAGSEDNLLYANAFEHNRKQVKYVATREQEWSFNGRGNYWSDYLGWDLDGDGIGDRPYQANDGVDQLLWKYPQAKILMHSPATQTLRWAQAQFPILRPPGVRDSHPLMYAPPPGGARP